LLKPSSAKLTKTNIDGGAKIGDVVFGVSSGSKGGRDYDFSILT
jgi:hypothetical protein